MITRRDWWLGVALIATVLLLQALVPRYEVRTSMASQRVIRIDRWLGTAEGGRFGPTGRWPENLEIMKAETLDGAVLYDRAERTRVVAIGVGVAATGLFALWMIRRARTRGSRP